VSAAAGFPLPAGFEDLARFREYARPTERERHAYRLGTPIERLDEVYAALLVRIEAMIAHLDEFDIKALPAPEQNLLYLAFAFVEVASSVELLRSPDVPEGFAPARFKVHF
jgi:hypothetical protein